AARAALNRWLEGDACVPPGVCAGGETPPQLAAGMAALRASRRVPFRFFPCIGAMNLRIARQHLGLRRCSGVFSWLALIAKAPEDQRTAKKCRRCARPWPTRLYRVGLGKVQWSSVDFHPSRDARHAAGRSPTLSVKGQSTLSHHWKCGFAHL